MNGGNGSEDPAWHGLTAARIEVLRLAARGLGTAEIAAELGVSVDEARERLQAAIRALGAHSKLEALLRAIRLRLLPPP